ncbi:MAG: hypothetical protein FJX23_07980 [Alphaproteobacteria bacterium]|nr:hypothetical protein [Alphaproteobacteria bacterium]
MSRIFAALIVVVSLLFSPVAEAACMTSADNCGDVHVSQSVDDHGDHQGQGEKAAHHHCCAHSVSPSIASASAVLTVVAEAGHIVTDEALSSFAVGPLLKPPSHV